MENNNKISIGRDTLRAELTTLELRLVNQLAQKSEVKQLENRIALLEADKLEEVSLHQQHESRLERLEESVFNIEKNIETLKEVYVGNKAVDKYKKWLFRGGWLVGLAVTANLILDAILIYNVIN